VKWKLEIETKLLGKNGIRIEIEIFFRMEITLSVSQSAFSKEPRMTPLIMPGV